MSAPAVDRNRLRQWVSELLTDKQLTLSSIRRYQTVVVHPEVDLKPTRRLLMLTLTTYINGPGEAAWPGLGTLSKQTGLARSTVVKELAALRDVGWLYVESGDARHTNESNRYWLRYPNADQRRGVVRHADHSDRDGVDRQADHSQDGVGRHTDAGSPTHDPSSPTHDTGSPSHGPEVAMKFQEVPTKSADALGGSPSVNGQPPNPRCEVESCDGAYLQSGDGRLSNCWVCDHVPRQHVRDSVGCQHGQWKTDHRGKAVECVGCGYRPHAGRVA